MNKEEILKKVQENYDGKKPDEMEKHDILMMTRAFSLSFIVIIIVTLLLNVFFNNSIAIAENAGIAFTTLGIANLYLDKNQKRKSKIIGDYITICIGIFFYIGYLSLLIGK